jgi:hypothetical protein
MQAEYKTCAVVLKALRAGRKQQETARFRKRAQVPGLPFEESFEPKSECWVGQMSLLSKINTKNVFWPHIDSGFCGLTTQNTAKITHDW